MLTGISVVCFAASYLVAFALEISRLFYRAVIRNAVMIGFASAGLIAQTIFLSYEFRQHWTDGTALITWYTGCMSLSWIIVACYLTSMLNRKKSINGLILLPTSLALILAAQLFPNSAEGIRYWGMIHGLSIVFGIALVVVGFIAGLMYLFQSHRLKQKLPPQSSFWLPSLERLQILNERSLVTSILLLGVGLISGILLNLTQSGGDQGIPWSDPVVLASFVWLAWLITVFLFNAYYKPSRSGQKVAYLTVGSFVFLGIVLGIIYLMPTDHGSTATKDQSPRQNHVVASSLGGPSR